MAHYPYLQDLTFLKAFNESRNKKQYIRICALDFQTEHIIQYIDGRATSGSISVANSGVRRTCNLSMIALDIDADITELDSLFSINKKVSIEIRYKNTLKEDFPIYAKYDEIIFPQGIFIISSASLSKSVSDFSISLDLQDKMCLLNGDVSGVIPIDTDFGEYYDCTADEEGNMVYTSVKPTIYQIIREAVNHFGKENLSKIIVEVDTLARQPMKWNPEEEDTKLYLVTDKDNNVSYSLTQPTSEAYQVIEKDGYVGYAWTDLTWSSSSSLSINAGGTVTSLLDQIVSYLGGNYEYFYDIDGNFVFREIRNYVNTTKATLATSAADIDYISNFNAGKAVYSFNDTNLIISLSRNPQYNKIKNDFVVLNSEKDSSTGVTTTKLFHLAIDSKPIIQETTYHYIEVPSDGSYTYTDENGEEVTISYDALKYAYKVPVEYETKNHFPEKGVSSLSYYNKADGKVYFWSESKNAYIKTDVEIKSVTLTSDSDWRNYMYLNGCSQTPYGTENNDYWAELAGFWTDNYNVVEQTWKKSEASQRTYYLDFIESAETDDISVSSIGRRTQVDSSTGFTYLLPPEVPDYIIIDEGLDDDVQTKYINYCNDKGYEYILVDTNIYKQISTGYNIVSAYELATNMLYTSTKYADSVGMNLLPVYNLDVNNMIEINDPQSGIYGEYLISSIEIPFGIDGTMSISCEKILNKM